MLKVIEEERLQHHALKTGEYLMQRLLELQSDFDFLGDVRGLGLMVGIECVTDSASKRHAPVMAAWIRVRYPSRPASVTLTRNLGCDHTTWRSCIGFSSQRNCLYMLQILADRTTEPGVDLPDSALTGSVECRAQEQLKKRRVLVTTDGPKDNVLKLKPPMVFGRTEVDHLLRELTAILQEELPDADREALLQPWSAPSAVQAAAMHRGGHLSDEQQQHVAEAALKKQRVDA